MHEYALMRALMRQIEAVARAQGAQAVTGVQVRLGQQAHITPEHFRAHFDLLARGTLAAEARLMITVAAGDESGDVCLESIDVRAD